MQKTRFGISANAYAGLAFLAGLISPLLTVIMAGAVLLTEDNDWLKRMVLKAVAFVVLVNVAIIVINELSDAIITLNNLLDYVDASFKYEKVTKFVGICASVVDVIYVIFILIFAKKAFAGQYVKLPVGDGIVEKNVQ